MNRLALAVIVAGVWCLALSQGVAYAGEIPPAFLLEWGASGSGDGQFSYPDGVAVDSSGNVYVADSGNSRVQKFSSSGDGTVCLQDLTAVAAAFGSTPASPQWNPAADLNHDGIINVFDLVIVGLNYGK